MFYIHCADDINKQLFDTESDFNIHIEEVDGDEELLIQLCNLLNKQQSTIKQLKQENKKLNRQLTTQDTINIQYREIIACLEIIIDELDKENRQLHYQIIKLQDKEG